MKTHELKTWTAFFRSISDGSKKFELRRDDRGFEVGDKLVLREYDPKRKTYSGHELHALVTYVLRDAPDFGLVPGFVILSFVICGERWLHGESST